MGRYRSHFDGEAIGAAPVVFKSSRATTAAASNMPSAPSATPVVTSAFDAFARRVAAFREMERAER